MVKTWIPKIKTSREIVFNEIKEYFPDDKKWDSEKWINYSELRDLVVQMGYQKKTLIDFYDKLFADPTIDGIKQKEV